MILSRKKHSRSQIAALIAAKYGPPWMSVGWHVANELHGDDPDEHYYRTCLIHAEEQPELVRRLTGRKFQTMYIVYYSKETCRYVKYTWYGKDLEERRVVDPEEPDLDILDYVLQDMIKLGRAIVAAMEEEQ